MADSPEAIKKATRLYLFIGAILFGGTLLTVAVAMVPWMDVGHHGFDTADMILGLAIATVKASLVALIFMHLNHERRLVYFFAGLAAIHCTGMILFIGIAEGDSIRDPLFYHGARQDDPGGVSVSRGPFPQTGAAEKGRGWFGP